jgi:hypothetical protein
MRIFVCKLRLLFSDNKHLRGFIGHEIFGNFFRHSEIFGLHPQLYMLATALPPPPLANISGKHFLGVLFILKVPLETRPPQLFEAPVIIYCLNCIRRDQNSTYKTGLRIFTLTNTYKSSLALLTAAELLLISVPSLQTWTAQMVLYLVPTVYV